MTDEQQQGYELRATDADLKGVYANRAAVHHTLTEFTIDFIREDPFTGRNLLVSRVAMAPMTMTSLIRALDEHWRRYAEQKLQEEMHDQLEGRETDDHGGQ